jgi:transcriptional regulator with XRE-family HTH domain
VIFREVFPVPALGQQHTVERWSGMDAGLFGSRLRELREAAGMSQAQLAEKVNVKQHAVSQWEHGHREPTLAVVVQLAETFGVTVMEFLEPAKRPRGRKRK